MSAPSLKDALERWMGLPELEPVFKPRLTQATASKVARLFDVPPRPPPPYDLEELYRRVTATWRRDHSLEGVANRDLRRLPWVLFYPQPQDHRAQRQGPSGCLGAQPGILREYGQWVSAGHRTPSSLALLHEFLRVYPVDLRTFDDLRRLLQKVVQATSSPPLSLAKWRQRCLDFGLLEEGGSSSFAEKLIAASDSVDDLLGRAGLEGGLARSSFLELGIREYLPNVNSRLMRDGLDTTELSRLLTLLECEGRLRFDEQSIRVEIASALLIPFIDQSPAADLKEQLQSFFLHHFGDPRLPSARHRWSGVGEEIRHVLTRWLVKEALDGFIQLIKETALDRHWRYREAFWMACFRKDIIHDARFILGSRASRLRKQLLKQHQGTAGVLRGAEGGQSVLLLRMSGVTVAEWSHNGACRFWLDGNANAPRLGGREYSGIELRRGSDFAQRHHSSQHGRWQDQVARWMRENTGASIGRSEYMPGYSWKSVREATWQRTSTSR